MGTATLSLTRQSTWDVETCHLIDHPTLYEPSSLKELKNWIQLAADAKKTRPNSPPLGELHFRYEADDDGSVYVIHSYFTDKGGRRRRFMRLRLREDDPPFDKVKFIRNCENNAGESKRDHETEDEYLDRLLEDYGPIKG